MRVDESDVLGQVGSVFGNVLGDHPFGRSTGVYVFADLAELDHVITQWRAERDKILARDEKIVRAIGLVAPPAEDMMSVGQANAFKDSLERLKEHNLALFGYADAYVKKLEATRASYTAVEDTSTTRMNSQGLGA
jgi:hypothetical protein